MFTSTLVSKVQPILSDSPRIPHKPLKLDFDDSDDDDPEEGTTSESRKSGTENSYYLVEVTSASYKTYRAVLCWILSDTIIFAPLNSAAKPTTGRRQSHSPGSPTPVSPKSVFCLAHFLEIPDFAQLALDEFEPQLTVENLAFELFGDVADRQEEIRELCLSFAVKQWVRLSFQGLQYL